MISIGKLHDPTSPAIPDVSDPLRLMEHCHKKIEAHLESLACAIELLHNKTAEDTKTAFALIDAAHIHLAGPGVKHTEDEEVSLFPRIRERGGNAGEEVFAAMSELETQHRTAKQLEADFFDMVLNLPRSGGELEKKDLERFAATVTAIIELYRPHISLENTLVFPIAARVLTPEDIQQLGSEILARRKVMLKRN